MCLHCCLTYLLWVSTHHTNPNMRPKLLEKVPIAPAPVVATPKPPEARGIKVKSFVSCQELKACARYLPVRLTAKERELLVLLEGALDVSEYTGNVDVYGHGKLEKQQDGLADFFGVLLGLLISK